MEKIKLIGEKHPCGGPGRFYLQDVRTLTPALAKEYEGRARLIYLDPPFGTGDTFSMHVSGKKRLTIPTYSDTLDEEHYNIMMRAVLRDCHTMLRDDGSLCLHVDYRKSAKMRLLLDDCFGESNFVNEIIWAYKSGGRSTKHFSYKHDNLFLYRKSKKQYFNILPSGMPRGCERRNHMKQSVDVQGRVCYSIRSAGKTYTYYEDSLVFPSDVWDDIEHLHQKDPERTGYNTQKPEALLKRIISVCSEEGDLVADFFSGSATTAAAASKLGRKWLAADASPLALSVLRKRMLQAYGTHLLLENSGEMTLLYAAENTDMREPLIEKNEGKIRVILPEEMQLQYVALGKAENEIFFPLEHVFSPGDELVFQNRREQALILQAVDPFGKQCFWKLD